MKSLNNTPPSTTKSKIINQNILFSNYTKSNTFAKQIILFLSHSLNLKLISFSFALNLIQTHTLILSFSFLLSFSNTTQHIHTTLSHLIISSYYLILLSHLLILRYYITHSHSHSLSYHSLSYSHSQILHNTFTPLSLILLYLFSSHSQTHNQFTLSLSSHSQMLQNLESVDSVAISVVSFERNNLAVCKESQRINHKLKIVIIQIGALKIRQNSGIAIHTLSGFRSICCSSHHLIVFNFFF
jgi:hypothetical protein